MLAHRKLRAENPHPVLYLGQQIADLSIGASFQSLAERG
jgi:hypothetical protein